MAVSSDGKNVYVPGGTIARYSRDRGTGKLSLEEEYVEERAPGAHFLAFSPDGSYAYVLCSAGIAWWRVE